MANFLTQQTEVALKTRLSLTDSGQLTAIKGWINRAGKEIWAAEDWNFTLDRQILQTVVDYTTGTVAVNASATAVTGTGTVFASTHVGSYIQFSTSNDWYKITASSSTTSLTIESPYVGSSNLTGSAYTIRQFFYSLGSTVENILSVRQAITPTPIWLMDYRDFDIFRPNPTSTGNPSVMIVFGQDSSNNLQVSLYPFPSAVENIEIRFKKKYVDLSLDTDVSLIPNAWNESVMIDGALAQGYDYVSVGNASSLQQAQAAYARFLAGIERMKATQISDGGKHHVIQSREVTSVPYGPRLPSKYGVT